MKQFIYHFILVGSLCFAAACSEELETGKTNYIGKTGNVVFTIEDFVPENMTKSAFQTNTMSFQWSADDVIGIFPEKGWQTEFSMQSGAGGNLAVFDGNSWGLKTDEEYYAYYPFSEENFESKDMRERVRYSYEGQEARFADENGLINLGKYDFMASGAGKLENGVVNFNFKHLGALCRIRFDVPQRASFTNMLIKADKELFSLSGYYDASDKDGDGIIGLVSDAVPSRRFSLPIPTGYQTYDKGEKVEFYFLLPPTDLSGRTLEFQLIDKEYNYYDAKLEGKNIQAGMSYGWDVEFDIYTSTETEAANCYIISESGTYGFPTVRGNGISYINGISSAEVLWESFGTDTAPSKAELISNVTYADNYISFSTGTGGYKEGNAVIAAKDADGNILWSWHIWLTDKPEDQLYNNGAGTVMDRNLGAISAAPGDVGTFGLLYQWGRKDPFPGGSSKTSNSVAQTSISLPAAVASDATVGTIEYAIGHPTTFIKYNSNNYDWYYSDVKLKTDNTRWQSKKTIYDPCPAGYRVPDGGYNGIWSIAFATSETFEESTYDVSGRGFDFGNSAMTNRLTNNITCWYPSSGYMYGTSGALNYVGSDGYYWACNPSQGSNAYSLGFSYTGNIDPALSSYHAHGMSVRCVRK